MISHLSCEPTAVNDGLISSGRRCSWENLHFVLACEPGGKGFRYSLYGWAWIHEPPHQPRNHWRCRIIGVYLLRPCPVTYPQRFYTWRRWIGEKSTGGYIYEYRAYRRGMIERWLATRMRSNNVSWSISRNLRSHSSSVIAEVWPSFAALRSNRSW